MYLEMGPLPYTEISHSSDKLSSKQPLVYIHNSPFIHIHSLYTTMAAARGEYMNISNNYVKKEYPDVMWYASNPKRDIKHNL